MRYGYYNSVFSRFNDPGISRFRSIRNTRVDNTREKMNTCGRVTREEVIDRQVDLNLKFMSSFEEKRSLFSRVSFDVISSEFNTALLEILMLNPDEISVDVTIDESVSIHFKKGIWSIDFDLFFEQGEEGEEVEAAVRLFTNSEDVHSFSDHACKALSFLKNKFTIKDGLSSRSLARA